MKVLKSTLLAVAFCLLTAFSASAQRNVKALLVDETSGDPIGFATVSLTKKGQEKAYKYILSNEAGKVELENVRKGSYEFKAEFLGYVPLKLELTVEDKPVDLGTLKMKLDQEQLDAAKVTALGNPIIVKKDTIEYNASSFKTTENDVLEDLLKKLPGVEVSEDGSITVNGQSINKITIDGKTFFLDDPQLASKNSPAKIVNKVKVIDKKSEQAEFTGIDDGQEETVIDLSIKPGMMNGTFGNVMAGAGHDVPSSSGISGDYRYQGAAFAGKFTDKTQISLVLNGMGIVFFLQIYDFGTYIAPFTTLISHVANSHTSHDRETTGRVLHHMIVAFHQTAQTRNIGKNGCDAGKVEAVHADRNVLQRIRITLCRIDLHTRAIIGNKIDIGLHLIVGSKEYIVVFIQRKLLISQSRTIGQEMDTNAAIHHLCLGSKTQAQLVFIVIETQTYRGTTLLNNTIKQGIEYKLRVALIIANLSMECQLVFIL